MQRTDLYNIKKSRTFLSNDTYVLHGRESDSIPRYKVTSNYYNKFKIEYLLMSCTSQFWKKIYTYHMDCYMHNKFKIICMFFVEIYMSCMSLNFFFKELLTSYLFKKL